eukprot:8989523-Alexandrium_andersonii.AAC.1
MPLQTFACWMIRGLLLRGQAGVGKRVVEFARSEGLQYRGLWGQTEGTEADGPPPWPRRGCPAAPACLHIAWSGS